MKQEKEAAGDLGLRSGLRLAVYYTLFFSIVMTTIFVIANKIISNNIHEDEMTMVENHAQEYCSWYLTGGLPKLQARMNEQLVKEGDILFAHISGSDLNYTNVRSLSDISSLESEIDGLDASLEGVNVAIGDRDWTIASVPVGDTDLVLQAGKYNVSLKDSLSNFRYQFFVIIIPACLIAVLGGTFLTYRSLAPLRNLTKTVKDILTSGELGRRAYCGREINELNALVRLFNDLLDRNENLVTNMRDSLDHIAHDLLTPVSRLRITAERALNHETDAELLREALADCVEESEYLEQLLSILLNVTEAKAGTMKLNKKTFAVKTLLEEVCDVYEFVAEEKNIKFSVICSDQVELTADRTRMMQVLANLVDNATKYSGENTKIELSSSMHGDHILISVRDQGEGISAENMPHIWNRLYRADQSRGKKGMGLGLSLVKAIIELHGGVIKVESELGKGTEFTLLLPAAAKRLNDSLGK